jgi:hypothetical protein
MGTNRNTAPERDGDQASAVAYEFLRPVIEGTTEYGSRARLGQLLSERLGTPVDRHLLKRMLNPDPAKRKQPHLGIGLIVREVFDKNRKQLSQPTQLQYWNRRPGKAEEPNGGVFPGRGGRRPTKRPTKPKTKNK